MKLLIVTQKVSQTDPILGFFHGWIEEFAKHCETVNVICLEEGTHHLPSNVKVYSLGKEKGASKMTYVSRFYQLITQLRNEYDTVFVHMNPEYVVLGGPLWKLWKKKISLWYVHRQVNAKLRVAEMFADSIFTSSKESFGIESKKVHYVGHGIDTKRFASIPSAVYEPLSIVHVGRITRIKNIATIIKALKYLVDDHVDAVLRLMGEPITKEDGAYKTELKLLIKALGLEEKVIWEGVMSNVEALTKASITVNAAPDGGMDKAVLESLAAGRVAFASNKAFRSVFGEYERSFMFAAGDGKELFEKLVLFLHVSDKEQIVKNFSLKVVKSFDVASVITHIITILS